MTVKTYKTDPILGQTIVAIRDMTQKELKAEYWDEDNIHGAPTVLVLSNGTKLYASQDEEGNGPGALFATDKDGTSFYVMPVTKG